MMTLCKVRVVNLFAIQSRNKTPDCLPLDEIRACNQRLTGRPPRSCFPLTVIEYRPEANAVLDPCSVPKAERRLVVRFQHLHPPDTTLGANVGNRRTSSKLMVLVELLNLTFYLELDVRRDSNVKFAPLEGRNDRRQFPQKILTRPNSGAHGLALLILDQTSEHESPVTLAYPAHKPTVGVTGYT